MYREYFGTRQKITCGCISLVLGFIDRRRKSENGRKEKHMLWTIAVVLIILWLLGLITGYTLGNFIHILLVIAIIVVVVRFVQGRRG